MLGSFALEGIEYIDSREQRSLVEHRVPGLAGSYFQDLGSAPNTLVVIGTRHGDDARDAFLEGMRAIFNAGEQTTFTADINTATDLTDVVIEDLQIAEVADGADSFRYLLRLRKYVEPPEPPAVALAGLDSDLLDAAGDLVGALDTLDALASIPNLGDPTPPLREAVGGVSTATSGLAPAVEELNAGLGSDPAGPAALPSGEELAGSLEALKGDAAAGTGVGGALAAVDSADVGGRAEALVSALDGTLAETLPAEGAGPGVAAVGRVSEAAGAMPEPAGLTAPLAEPLDRIAQLVSGDVAGGVLGGLSGLERLVAAAPGDPAELVAGALQQLDGVTEGLGAGRLGAVRQWGDAVSALEAELAPILAAGGERAKQELVTFLAARAEALGDSILPDGQGAAAAFAAAVDAASTRTAAIGRAASDLRGALERARTAFEASRFAATAEVAEAEASLRALAAEAAALAAELRAAADLDAATPEGLAGALHRLHDDFRAIEVVDLGAPAEAIGDAFEELRAAIATVDLGRARAGFEGVLDEVTGALEQLDLSRLTGVLDEAEATIRDALAGLDGAVLEVLALARSGFTALRDALRVVRDALGSVGADGRFHFTLEAQLETLLTNVRSVVTETILPALEEFRAAVGEAIGKVSAALDEVTGEVESVKAQLQGAIHDAAGQLRAADVAGTMGRTGAELENALSQLGAIDFDPVVDSVVAQIEDMTGQLRSIDPADLNEILRAALAAAVVVIEAIDFPNDITAVLMDEIDRVLDVPVNAMDELQARVDAMLDRFRELAPESIVAPLSGLFEPLLGALDGLEVDALAAPIAEWHARARATVESVLPATALAPLVEAHKELMRAFDSISTQSLVDSVNAQLAGIKAELERLEPAGLVEQLASGVGDARGLLASLSPDVVFAPLTAAFDRVDAALRDLAPEKLLEPLTRLSGAVSALLANVTDDDARLAAAAFAPLAALPAAFDPRASFETAAASAAEAEALVARLNLGTLLAGVRTRQAGAAEALAAGGDAGAALVPRVQALDPLRDAQVTQAVADLQHVRARLRGAFPSAEPPAELETSYAGIREDVEGLVPEWTRGTPTAASLRAALAWVDTATIVAGAGGVHAELVEQWAALDPRPFAEQLEHMRAAIDEQLAAVDPTVIAGRIQGLVGELGPQLDALDLQPIAAEAQDLQADVRDLLAALDPRPVIDQLASLAVDVERVVDELDPAAVLAELAGPLESAKALLRQFDPAALAEALQPAFAEIQAILDQVDLRTVLQPLVDRLRTLRTELENALERTEQAFRGMIATIPT
jgi:tetrahydromethanopterin S-methyltransferase subunit B